MRRTVLIILLITGILTASKTAGRAGSFLRYGLDARSESLGRSVTADTSSAYSIFFNPSTSAGVNGKQILAGLKILSMDRDFAYLLYSQPIDENASLGLGLLYTGTGDIEGRDRSGYQFETYSYNENLFFLNFSIKPKKFLQIGVSAKLLWSRFPEFDASDETVTSLTFAYDAGAVFILPYAKKLIFGLSAKNIKGKNSWDSSKVWTDGSSSTHYYPVTYSAGLSWRPVFNPDLGLYADIHSHDLDDHGYGFGIEWGKQIGGNEDVLSLRTGTVSGKLSFGFGYEFKIMNKKVIVDYAYTKESISEYDPHSLSWRFFF